MPPLLLTFHDPVLNAPDPKGRTLPAILAWPDHELESRHDYIQYLFPLPEPSPFNPSAPLITREVFVAFRARADLRARLAEAFARMLQFWGFEMMMMTPAAAGNNNNEEEEEAGDVEVKVVRGPLFGAKARNWVMAVNHNHLRMTRLIRCLRVLGLGKEARAFHGALREVALRSGGRIGARSLGFWDRAARRPLWIAPEEGERGGEKRGFLWELEGEEEGG